MVNAYDTIDLENEEEISDNSTNMRIDHIDDSISYNYFFRNYMLKNKPCIIKLSSVKVWASTKDWVFHGYPNFEFLQKFYGLTTVPVADCGEKYYNVQKKSSLCFSEYLAYWEKYISSGYSSDMPCLYLKDWHFTKDFPEHIVYRVPKYFASDWLNEFLSSKTEDVDDYRFVYMGPKGSWTPLHADVFTSYSWSVNVSGQKRWLLFPPGQEKYLKDKLGNLIYDATNADLINTELQSAHLQLTPLDIIQEAGEAIFVPTGWHHQVWNLEDTISINHNWINGCNIGKMWQSMQSNLTTIKNEIRDCQDMENWDDHCQVMLQAVFGMNYNEFYKFLTFITLRRLESLNNTKPLQLYGNWSLGTQHIVFDLQQAKEILQSFLSNTDFKNLQFFNESYRSLQDICCEIENCLQRVLNTL